jgi:signal transduction histidine kinase
MDFRSIFFRQFILVCFSALLLPTKGQEVDSLERALSTAINPIQRIDILNTLSRNLIYVNTTNSLHYANEALDLARKHDYPTGVAYAYRNISSLYSYQGLLHLSMDYIERSRDIFQELGDSVGIANVYISLGHTFRRLNDREQEIKYNKKAYDLFQKLEDNSRKGIAALNLGETYFYLGEYTKSRQHIIEALDLVDKSNLSAQSACYKVLGWLDMQALDYPTAELNFLQVLDISKRLGENSQKVATVESLISLASLYKKLGKTNLQVEYLKRAAEFSAQYNLSSDVQLIFTELISYFAENNQPQEVKRYVEEFKAVNENINKGQLADRAELTSRMLQLHDLEKSNQMLEHANMIQKERLKQRGLILGILLLFSISLIWFLFRLSRANRKIELVNDQLKIQKETIEAQHHHLEVLNETKNKFFSIIAHDLRSPIITLQSYIALLIEHVDALSKDEIKKMGGQVQISVDNTLKMMDNLLTWARMQMNEIETKPELFSIDDVIQSTCAVFRDMAEKKSISLTLNSHPTNSVYGDKNQITFVIRNLINNAIKFTKPEGSVTITQQISNGETMFEITDSGIGMPAEVVANIMSGTNKHTVKGTMGEKGTGLGLNLSTEFIAANHGRLTIESSEGIGTSIRVYLPSEG